MNVLILTYGSRGDVQPYIALGKGLAAEGYHVTIATSHRFRDYIESFGLQYGYMNDDMLAMLDTREGREMLESTQGMFDVVKHTFRMIKKIGPIQKALVWESWNAALQSRPDLIIFHPKAYGAPHFAGKLGVPVVMALVVPGLVPTAEYPNMVFPSLRLGAWYNRATYAFIDKLLGLSVGKHVKQWRIENGLPINKGFDLLHTTDGKDIPVLHGFSEHVLSRPSDWPVTATVTGYWFLDKSDGWTPPSELKAFLEDGPAPVYVGFGSMVGRNPELLGRVVIEALQEAGERGIIATGWGGLRTERLPKTILKIDEAPHAWLFPRVSAVIHHGGAGTSAAALRAGKPSVVVPFFGDQPFWGRLIRTLGAGSHPIPLKEVTVAKLAAAIKDVASNPLIKDKASKLGEKIRSENGIGKAVATIDNIMGRPNKGL